MCIHAGALFYLVECIGFEFKFEFELKKLSLKRNRNRKGKGERKLEKKIKETQHPNQPNPFFPRGPLPFPRPSSPVRLLLLSLSSRAYSCMRPIPPHAARPALARPGSLFPGLLRFTSRVTRSSLAPLSSRSACTPPIDRAGLHVSPR